LQGFGEAAESVLYTFDLLMLRGKDVRSWAIEERRGRLLEIAQQLPRQFDIRKHSMRLCPS
jgi:ATP-dependent DNA ligase